MSADPIVYCLEHLTDYDQFERLCSDLMAGQGYEDIEPLGGRSDEGRDAIHIARSESGRTTLFAYTVRADWRRKLNEDCQRIRECGHRCEDVVFVSTSRPTPRQKDVAEQFVHEEFGWSLDIHDIERIRVALTGPLRHLIPAHPAIFCPPWFPRRGGESVSFGRDLVVIDHVSADHSVATWLSRKLQLAGYATWCLGTAPLAGENQDETVRLLIENRAVRYLPLLSSEALLDVDFVARCTVASSRKELVVPCIASGVDLAKLSTALRAPVPVRLDESWAQGLRSLLEALAVQEIPRSSDDERGRAVALSSFVPEPLTRDLAELVYASVFGIRELPLSVIVFSSSENIVEDEITSGRKVWAFSKVAPSVFAAFCEPPSGLEHWRLRRRSEVSWSDVNEVEGRRLIDIVKELLRRSAEVAGFRAGLAWCGKRAILHFPHTTNPNDNVAFTHVDGTRTRFAATGVRQIGTGEKSRTLRYQLAPLFRVGQDPERRWWLTTRIYVRVTDESGTALEGKAIQRGRKKVTRSWWNQHWFARTIGVMRFIADDADTIVIGPAGRQVVFETMPLRWECPVSIDEEAVGRVGNFDEEMASLRFEEEYNEFDD